MNITMDSLAREWIAERGGHVTLRPTPAVG